MKLPFLDLGSAPPSNAYLEALDRPEIWIPLRLMVCETCWLVQTEDFAAPETLFDSDYAYFSSVSASWLAHARRYAEDMSSRFDLTSDSMVCEVAANDGYLLKNFVESGIPCYGIEPTAKTAQAARGVGVDIVQAFFTTSLAESLSREGRSADLVAANNVLAHVPDINDFVRGFSLLLKPNGVATFEFPHVLSMVMHNQFDTAYHEHFSYLSLTTVTRIFRINGLDVFDVQHLSTHGGSLRVFAQRFDVGTRPVEEAVAICLASEGNAGIATATFYEGLQKRAETIKDDLVAFLIGGETGGLACRRLWRRGQGQYASQFRGSPGRSYSLRRRSSGVEARALPTGQPYPDRVRRAPGRRQAPLRPSAAVEFER